MSFYADANLSDYYGYGNWKLRTDLSHPKSFIHETIAYEVSTNFKTIFQLNNSIALTTTLEIITTIPSQEPIFFTLRTDILSRHSSME